VLGGIGEEPYMRTIAKLDTALIPLLCCPLCKGVLRATPDQFACKACASTYPLTDTRGGAIYDFRIHRPRYATPLSLQRWSRVQSIYEKVDHAVGERDNLQGYLDEIDAVKEIYTTEFHISGNVLDVGGSQGTLRHYLSDHEVPIYISVDPFLSAFDQNSQKPNLLHAYSCLSTPLNFLSAHAESLPFVACSFDWVHMRSVLDHLADPYLALKEAYRVLKPDGRLMIGIAVPDRAFAMRDGGLQRVLRRIRTTGVLETLKAVAGKLGGRFLRELDDHAFRLKHEQLRDLLVKAGFRIEKEHWQKPPFTYCIYLSARKI